MKRPASASVFAALLILTACASPPGEDYHEFMGRIYGLQLKQQFESRQADIDFKRAEADLMRQHAGELRRRATRIETPAEQAQIFRQALQWAAANPNGGTFTDRDGRSTYFDAVQVSTITLNARAGLRALGLTDEEPQGVIRWRPPLSAEDFLNQTNP